MHSLNEKIEDEIQKTLQVPNSIERVEGNPYLLTRIQSRLEEKNNYSSYSGMQVPVMVMIVTLLILNSFVLFQSLSFNNTSTDNVLTEYLFPQDEATNWIDYLN